MIGESGGGGLQVTFFTAGDSVAATAAAVDVCPAAGSREARCIIRGMDFLFPSYLKFFLLFSSVEECCNLRGITKGNGFANIVGGE